MMKLSGSHSFVLKFRVKNEMAQNSIEQLRATNQVVPVSKEDEGRGWAKISNGVYGFSYTPASSDGGLFNKQPRQSYEMHKLTDGSLLILGYTTAEFAGKLDLKLYGPSFRDFVIEKPEHSPHYEYHLHDPEDPSSHRRSIYRFAVRSQTQPFLTALDCADPSLQVDRRNQSQSPAQALALLNNDFMAVMAKHFAKRLEARPGELSDRVERGFWEATGRKPGEAESKALTAHAVKHGLPSLCRLLFNLNEFAFAD